MATVGAGFEDAGRESLDKDQLIDIKLQKHMQPLVRPGSGMLRIPKGGSEVQGTPATLRIGSESTYL